MEVKKESTQSWKSFWLVGAFALIGIGVGELIGAKSACTLIGTGIGMLIYVIKK